MASNPSRSLAEIEATAPASGAVARLVKGLAPYKELIAIIAAVVGSAYFVVDYFATKQDVKVLNCQMRNSIALVESRVNGDRRRVELQDASVERMNVEREEGATQGEREQRQRRLATLDSRISSIRIAVQKETDAEENAAQVLRFNQCGEERAAASKP